VTSSSSEFGEAREQLTVEYQGARSRSRSTRSTCSTSSTSPTPTCLALPEGRSQPGSHEARRRAGVRVHLRDHADANLTENFKDTRGTSRTQQIEQTDELLTPELGIRRPEWERICRRLRRRQDQGSRRPRGRSEATRHVHRVDRASPAAPSRLRGSSTTPSTRRWPVSATRSTLRFTSTTRLRSSTTAAVFQ
jgi:hypothetical protein